MAKAKSSTTRAKISDYTCPKCHNIFRLTKDNFYVTGDSQYTIYCKVCLQKMCWIGEPNGVNSRLDVDGIVEALKILNRPFVRKIFDSNVDKNQGGFALGDYLRDVSRVHKGKTFEDTDDINGASILKGRKKTDVKKLLNNMTEEQKSFIEYIKDDDEKELYEKRIKFWGKNFEKDDLDTLQEYYEEITKTNDHSTFVQINLYKNMAKTQLLADKCIAEENMQGYEKNMKILSSLQNDANIKPVQETGANANEQAIFGVMIKKFENERPIPKPNPEWEDVDNIIWYVTVWFLGHLCKMLGIKNEYASQYEMECQKYTVQPPEFKDDDDEDVWGEDDEYDEDTDDSFPKKRLYNKVDVNDVEDFSEVDTEGVKDEWLDDEDNPLGEGE